MAVVVSTPSRSALPHVVHSLRGWQDEAAPLQLHPGDLGWYWQLGPDAMAAALRTWSRDDELVAIGPTEVAVMTPDEVRSAINAPPFEGLGLTVRHVDGATLETKVVPGPI